MCSTGEKLSKRLQGTSVLSYQVCMYIYTAMSEEHYVWREGGGWGHFVEAIFFLRSFSPDITTKNATHFLRAGHVIEKSQFS